VDDADLKLRNHAVEHARCDPTGLATLPALRLMRKTP
jgi:hypothetical protein